MKVGGRIDVLKNRSDFLRLSRGPFFSSPGVVVQAQKRVLSSSLPSFRVGFTVTKKIGNAVVRNRVRRRLREAVLSLFLHMHPEYDYVFIGRSTTLTRPFSLLQGDLSHAMGILHSGMGRKPVAIRKKSVDRVF